MLNPDEAQELQRLLNEAQFGILTPQLESRMRYLISKQNPQASQLNLQDLIRAGLVIIGLYFLFKLLQE